MQHRTRDLLMRQRTQLINALRAHLAELGIAAAQGNAGLKELLKIIAGERDARLPVDAHASLVVLAAVVPRGADDDRIVRQTDRYLASLEERGQQAAQEHPWDRSSWPHPPSSPPSPIRWHSARVVTSRPGSGSTRAGVGIGSENQQTGGSRSAQPVRGQRTRRHSPCQDPRHQVSALGRSVAGTPATKSPPSRLPTSSPEWPVATTGEGERRPSSLAEGLTRSRRVPWRDVRVGRANST